MKEWFVMCSLRMQTGHISFLCFFRVRRYGLGFLMAPFAVVTLTTMSPAVTMSRKIFRYGWNFDERTENSVECLSYRQTILNLFLFCFSFFFCWWIFPSPVVFVVIGWWDNGNSTSIPNTSLHFYDTQHENHRRKHRSLGLISFGEATIGVLLHFVDFGKKVVRAIIYLCN